MNFIRSIAGRVAGGVAVGLASWLAAAGLDVSAEAIAYIEDAIFGLIMGTLFIIYGVSHKFVNRKVNPSDDAQGDKLS